MASSLNAGFRNNINIIQIRTSGTSALRVTDRAIDFNGDGNKETPSNTDPAYSDLPQGIARTIIASETETDRGYTSPYTDGSSEFTKGIN